MFKVTRVAPNRIEIELSGKLDAETMNVALDDLARAADGIEDGEMLYRIGELAMPTFGALKVEFSRLPSMLKLIGHFRRCAVIAEQGWLKTLSEIEGALIPGLDIKGFNRDQLAMAEAWLKKD